MSDERPPYFAIPDEVFRDFFILGWSARVPCHLPCPACGDDGALVAHAVVDPALGAAALPGDKVYRVVVSCGRCGATRETDRTHHALSLR
jgi:hypothetical protein